MAVWPDELGRTRFFARRSSTRSFGPRTTISLRAQINGAAVRVRYPEAPSDFGARQFHQLRSRTAFMRISSA